jgi:membrane associated rhomboid family serine protease
MPMVGASGAIAGVMGAYLVLFPHGVIRITLGSGVARRVVSAPASVLILVWFGQQFLNGIASLNATASFAGGIAFWAHVGGFVAGAGLVWLFKDQAAVERQRQAQAAQQNAAPARSNAAGRRPGRPGDPPRPGPL